MANAENGIGARPAKDLTSKGRLSTAEKLLFCIAIFAFILCVTLLVSLGLLVSHHTSCNGTSFNETVRLQKRHDTVESRSADHHNRLENHEGRAGNSCYDFCSSSSCQNEASFLLANIDEDVDPCDDIYRFACGNFIKSVVIPDDANKVDVLGITQRRTMTEMLNEMNQEIKRNELSAFKKLKTYYRNCMNENLVERDGKGEFLAVLDSLGGWPVLLDHDWDENRYDWVEAVHASTDFGFAMTFPALVFVGIDQKNTTRNLIKIMNAQTSVSHTYFLDSPNGKIVDAYYNYMVDVAVMLGADKEVASREMRDCLDFEIELFKIKRPIDEMMDMTLTYNPITIKELSTKSPSIPWLEIISRLMSRVGIAVDEEEVVVLNDPEFVAKLGQLISRTPKRVLANHLTWQVVSESVDYLPSGFLDRKLRFSALESGITKRETRASACVNDVFMLFPISLSAIYVRKHFNPRIRDDVLELVHNVKDQFKQTLIQVDWMDDETRRAALEKIDAMDVLAGYSDELFDDEKIDDYYGSLEIEPGSYLRSAFNFSLFFMKRHYQTLRKPVTKKDWTSYRNAAVINAYYYVPKNSFEIPAGFLQRSYFDNERPNYLNYGAIGSIVGHEITHGFDNEGSKNDKDGNQVDWWRPSTKAKYLQKADCIVDQYSNYTVEEIGMNLNGKRLQGENIADNGGFKTAYLAYDAWARRNGPEPCLPGLNYTAQQMFWISAANNWCSKEKSEYLRELVSRDPHSPAAARVTLSFANIQRFADDFGCSPGTRMNPTEKCVVW